MDDAGLQGLIELKEHLAGMADLRRIQPVGGVSHVGAGAKPEGAKLAPKGVDLWLFDTALLSGVSDKDFRTVLSQDELSRASRFHSAIIRSGFETGRAVVRTILSRYAGLPADEVVFSYGYRGKPYLLATGLHVNWSHSGTTWLLAVTASGDIGVDIEREANATDWVGPVSLAFSTDEIAFVICDSDPERSRRHFLEVWTRKEALFKASGKGLHDSMAAVSVIGADGRLSLNLDSGNAGRWWFSDIEVGDGAEAALATAFQPGHIRSFDCRASKASVPRKRILPLSERNCPVSNRVEPSP